MRGTESRTLLLSLRHARPLVAGATAWLLTPDQWREVDSILVALAAAVDAEDRPAAGRELARLALCVPTTRVARGLNPAMGEPSREGPGEATRTVINHLVHALVGDDVPADEARTGVVHSGDHDGGSS
jgi:hypothetical protein